MPAPLMSKDEMLARLMETFRKDGYDGASLNELSSRTGLGKSSLYHHFPDGKQQMATEVLAFLDARFSEAFAPLAEPRPPQAKLEALLEVVDAFYAAGKKACLLERLAASVDRAAFAKPMRALFASFMDAFARLCREAGLDERTAKARAESAVVRIEGALVVAAGTGDSGVFARMLQEIRASLLDGAPAPAKRSRAGR